MNGIVLRVDQKKQNGAARSRVAVVGGGLAGLASAMLLAESGQWDVSVFERSPIFGGRAAEDPSSGEHCPRMMLPDYDSTFELLRRIPGADNDATVLDTVTRVRRMEWNPRGNWLELDHMNRFRASGLSLPDRVAIYRQSRRRPLVAETYGPNRNLFGPLRQYSMASLVRIVRNVWRADKIFAFPGSTSRFLIEPMIGHLLGNGVNLHPSTSVSRIVLDGGAHHDATCDAVVLALFPSDLARLLDVSHIGHTLSTTLRHAHCKVLTVTLDPREPVLADPRPLLFCRAGLAVLVQPEVSRCVVLCTKVASTDDGYILDLVRAFLSLRHPVGRVLVRDNHLPGEAVWSATLPKAAAVLPVRPPGLHLAGSWLASGYPYESAESAIRSASRALAELGQESGVTAPSTTVPPGALERWRTRR
jgi:hypothetical protein